MIRCGYTAVQYLGLPMAVISKVVFFSYDPTSHLCRNSKW